MMREDWIEVEFSNIAINLKRGPFGGNLKKEFFVSSGYKVYEQKHAINKDYTLGSYFINDQKYRELQGFAVEANDYIISCSGTIGKLYRLPPNAPNGVINQALLKIKIQDKLINHSYFSLLFESEYFQRKILSDARGTGMQNLAGMKEIKLVTLPLAPLPEQRAIAAKIEQLFSELDNGIANLKTAKSKLEIYRQAILKQAFEGELTKNWRKNNPYSLSAFLENLKTEKQLAIIDKKISKDNYFPDTTENNKIYSCSENWLQLPWKTICSNNKYAMKRGPFGSALKKEFFVDSGYTVYEQGHAINDDPYRDRYFISKEKYEELKAFSVKHGDMIISCSGSLGRICLLPKDCKAGIINQALLKIDLDEKIISKKLFLLMFRSETFQRKIFQKSLGTAIPNMVAMAELKEFLIPIPSIEEQNQIVQEIETRLSVCDKLNEAIDQSLEKAQALRQSILKKAFEGKLLSQDELQTCRQQPDWETAAKLLERVKDKKNKLIAK